MRALLFWLVLLLSLLSLFVQAHDVSIIHNALNITQNSVVFSNDGSFVRRFGADGYQDYLERNVLITNNQKRCNFSSFQLLASEYPDDGFQVFIVCSKPIQNVSVEDSTFSLDSSVVNKVYDVTIGLNRTQYVGNGHLDFIVTQSPPTNLQLFSTYFILGLRHISTGIDHILFIVGFILIATSFTSLLKSITGFTLSHSLTLTLAAMGILVVSSKIVEPIIAMTIILVGLLSFMRIKSTFYHQFWVIFLFGLFHGLGFAGAISEIGFPKSGFIISLAAFNIGIEIGQIGIVLLVYPIICLIDTSPRYGPLVRKAMAGIVVIAGVWWFIARLLMR